ncbi:MAG: hypothetical protein JWO53_677 [Chlamydiia bacterium]|nr:hypothetical protein [Chlamydiia bacterium]
MKKIALCLLKEMQNVEKIVPELHTIGFRDSDISIVHMEGSQVRSTTGDTSQPGSIKEGAKIGASQGAVVGGVLGLLATLGVMSIPGIGPLLVTGPIAAALTTVLSGSALGGSIGGIAGALIGYGLEREHAAQIEESLKSGQILLTVESDDEERTRKAVDVYKKAGAESIHPI